MKKKTQGQIVNRRAKYDYVLGEDLIVGLSLTGAETKAARLGHIGLKGSYVTLKSGELYLTNASFTLKSTEPGVSTTVDTRDRKILAHKKQIATFENARKTGLTIIPVKMLNKGRFIKLVIATGKGKKNYDKRETIKKRDLERENK